MRIHRLRNSFITFLKFTLFLCILFIYLFLQFPDIIKWEAPVKMTVSIDTTATGKSNTIPKKDLTYQKSSSAEVDSAETKTILAGSSANIIYYSQSDPRWAEKPYGKDDPISTYGCGPTVLAMLFTSLMNQEKTPDEMAKWAYTNGFYSLHSGSYHSIIPTGCKKLGLSVSNFKEYTKESLLSELQAGHVMVALMGKGYFTDNGHFIILNGVDDAGMIQIADPNSLANSLVSWDADFILKEAKYSAHHGGPFWSIQIP